MNTLLISLVLLFSATFGCTDTTPTNNTEENYQYNSDYFVFVADTVDEPLVIPIDIDWYPTEKGYASEFKSWYGTKKEWPIGYAKQASKKTNFFPKEVWDFKNAGFISFNKNERELITAIPGAPKIRLKIPNESEWKVMPTDSKLKKMFAFRSSAFVKNKERSGWVIYERIRWDAELADNFDSFKSFFWLPIIIDNAFYHFEQHKGEQTASKWSFKNSKIEVETIPSFTLNQKAFKKDSKSQRTTIPTEIQIVAPEWDVDLTLKSTGEQVGYGEKFPKGLAYYRQSLLEPSADSVSKGYGMLELILEND